MALRGETERKITALTVTFPSGSPTSNAFTMGPYGLGLIWLPSGFTGFYLGAQVGTAAASLAALVDGYNSYGGSDVSCLLPTAQLIATRALPMPPFWFGASNLQLLAHNGSASGIPQDSARVCTITLKT
jgi:hypothetical protein